MKEAFAIIGLLFMIFSAIAFDVWRRHGDKEGAEAFKGVVLAIWLLIGFGVGSWLISLIFVGGLEMLHWVSERTHVPFWFLLCTPFLVAFVIGLLSRRPQGQSTLGGPSLHLATSTIENLSREVPRGEGNEGTPRGIDATAEWGYIEEVMGPWEVKYPGPDGMIKQDYVERLELQRDGTYIWDPPPTWAPRTGKWGVVKTRDGQLRLCFEEKASTVLRCNYLVLMQFPKDGPFYLNWQRTRGEAVIFVDRIFCANRPKDWFAMPCREDYLRSREYDTDIRDDDDAVIVDASPDDDYFGRRNFFIGGCVTVANPIHKGAGWYSVHAAFRSGSRQIARFTDGALFARARLRRI